jgi:hypothetical protein
LGYAKAFEINKVPLLSQSIPKNLGMLFLFTAVLFIISLVMFLLDRQEWFFISLVAVIISQILILIYWQDAKFGTIANSIILIVSIIGLASWSFKNTFENDVNTAFVKASTNQELITQKDIDHLPMPVQNYLNYVGIVGKPRVSNLELTFQAEMRGKEQDWFSFTSQQHTFFAHPTRLFFMEAKVKRLPTAGYHYYKGNVASMRIKLLSLFSVVDISTPELFIAETVTFFNDLCLFAPAVLIDDRIQWETINDTSVKAYFRNQETTIAAILYFNEEGQLINFVSDDRYDINEMKKYRFSTPISKYKNFNGYMLPSYGEAIWHYPDGEFVYGKFDVKSVEYNAPN